MSHIHEDLLIHHWAHVFTYVTSFSPHSSFLCSTSSYSWRIWILRGRAESKIQTQVWLKSTLKILPITLHNVRYITSQNFLSCEQYGSLDWQASRLGVSPDSNHLGSDKLAKKSIHVRVRISAQIRPRFIHCDTNKDSLGKIWLSFFNTPPGNALECICMILYLEICKRDHQKRSSAKVKGGKGCLFEKKNHLWVRNLNKIKWLYFKVVHV